MTRIERDSNAIKTIIFSTDYEKIITEMLDPIEALNLETVISETLHKFYSDNGVKYYDSVEKTTSELVSECAVDVLNDIKDKKTKLIDKVTNTIKKLGYELKSDFTPVKIDAIINIELVKESLEKLFGNYEYVEPILKEYAGIIIRKI